MDILAGVTVVRGTFSSLPVHSGALWEGSCLVSFWISCETDLARLPGTEKSSLIIKELKILYVLLSTVREITVLVCLSGFLVFPVYSGLQPCLLILMQQSLQSGNLKRDSGLYMTFWPSLNVFGMKWEFSLVQTGESMRNIQSTIQQ